MQKVLQLELNEVNFEFVEAYGALGKLPVLTQLIKRHGLIETTSEQTYDQLEPWIQWVSAHTGLTLGEHGVFRLGDIRDRPEIEQIWEVLERAGLRVGAVSPMNARNACADPAFFVPDPWTGGRVVGSALIRRLYDAIAQLVNDNAQARVEPASLAWLGAGLLRFAQLRNYGLYTSITAQSLRKSWPRALVLDLLLADVFIRETNRTKPDFASLFLNAAAHIQHHHMFDSRVYAGPHRNPEWYGDNDDPILRVYELYDNLLGQILQAFPGHRLLIATGLHQVPYPDLLFYWRLRDHEAFLRELDVAFERVEPRMSRDFVVFCRDRAQAKGAERILASASASDGERLFEIDNRGESLFVLLRYPADIPRSLGYTVGNRTFSDLRTQCAFVAIKNGEHDGIGYLIDTAETAGTAPRTIPVTSLFSRAIDHFRTPGVLAA
ncbi:MAG: hypothetical protein B7Z33_12190 [Sphingomonadales bacterium 12-68-11]|nr:MAG: hypothetical protein B7Z33_12190 [Sphingomonadales bacterium 12-68-11]